MKKRRIFLKWISCITALLLAVSSLSVGVLAEETDITDLSYYTEDTESDTDISYADSDVISDTEAAIDGEENIYAPEIGYIFENRTEEASFVFISVGEENDSLSDVILNYTLNGEAKSISGEARSNVAAFAVEDGYSLVSIEGTINGETFCSDLQKVSEQEEIQADLSNYQLETDEAYSDENTRSAADDEYDSYIAQANLYDSSEIVEALENSADDMNDSISAQSVNGRYVVVIDPGHGPNSNGVYCGATRTWDGVTYYEDVINMKIAKALKTELESYGNVDVYLTRDENSNPSLQERVLYAKNLNADMLVSCHINASTSSSANGLMAMVAKIGTYNTYNAQAGQNIANTILNELLKLGFNNNYGLYFRMDEDENPLTYPDGSVADYYGICRYGQLYNVPSIIIEHGFISNYEECLHYFNTDTMMSELGKSDATAIAKYLNLSKSSDILNGWIKDSAGAVRYYINGVAQTGTFVVNGKKYWLDSDGVLTTGWLELEGMKLYFDPDNGGVAATGVETINGTTYVFDENGVMLTITGLLDNNGDFYNFVNGIAVTGWYDVPDRGIMYFDSQNGCKAAIGTVVVDGKKYWFNENGVLTGGWLELGGMKLYFDPYNGGAAVIGVGQVEGRLCLFDNNGVQITGTCTPVINGDKYYLINDVVQSGWAKIGSWTVYLDPNNGYKFAIGSVEIEGTVYNFDSNGILTGVRSGMFVENGKKYLADDRGRFCSGWIDLTSYWRLYFDPNDGYAAATGIREIGGKYYCFNSDGILLKNAMPVVNGKKYLADKDGVFYSGWLDLISSWRLYFDPQNECAAATGFYKINNDLYHFNLDGILTCGGTPVIDGKKYIIDSNGKIATGWKRLTSSWTFYCNPDDNGAVCTGWNLINGKKFYFDSNGLAYLGFVTIDGNRYYFDIENGQYSGVTAVINGEKYAFDGDGKQCFGWYTLGNWKMYFDPDNNGAAVTDSIVIDNIIYEFNSDGVLTSSNVDSVKKVDPNSGRSYTLEGTFLTDPQIGTDITEDEFFAAVVYAEAGNQGIPGQTAVALVILNRLHSESYANTLSYVIYQKTHFEVARNGSLTKYLTAYKNKDESILKYIENAKTMEAVQAAKNIMNNYLNFGTPRKIDGISSEYNIEDFGCMYFVTPAAFERQKLDPVKCETFQYKNIIFFNKWIKLS